jgi:hypothetical protein
VSKIYILYVVVLCSFCGWWVVTKGAMFIDSVVFYFYCDEALFLSKMTDGMQCRRLNITVLPHA